VYDAVCSGKVYRPMNRIYWNHHQLHEIIQWSSAISACFYHTTWDTT